MATKKEKKLLEKIKILKKELETEREDRKNIDLKHFKNESIIIVTNRLPVVISKDPSTMKWTTKVASGGLVSAMSCIKMERKWIGWIGIDVPEEEKPEVNELLAELNCIPVYLPKDLYEDYYNGFSNDILWPILHYVQLPIQTLLKERDYWYAYEDVNRRFATVVLENSKKNQIIWIHDYHLMILPQYLREVRQSAKIAWFLHTPFPSSDIYSALCHRSELLRGVLSCDLVGFHIYNYVHNFKNACSEILGCDSGADAIELNGKLTLVDAFPIGIDVNKFENVTTNQSFKDKVEELSKQYKGLKIIIGVDRLDYVKGIMHKLVAFERFLESNQEWIDKVTYLQIAVPTRTEVPEYKKLADNVHELVGRINGKYSNLTHVPIQYLDQSIDLETLTALYRLADVCLITSLRDGMNLVSYEFIASQSDTPGVLILSEFAGAAQCLGAGSIRINPWNIEEVARAIREAVTISDEEKLKLYKHAKKYVIEHTSQRWSEDFLYTLKQSWEITNFVYKEPKHPSPLKISKIIDSFRASKRRLIFCGVIGTLTEIEPINNMNMTEHLDYLKLSDSIMESLRLLAEDENTTVLIATSRRKEFMDKLLEQIPAIFCAENGYYLKNNANKGEWEKKKTNLNLNWLEAAEKVMQYFCERTPNSFIERMETSICWHYSDSLGDFSEKQARDLVSNLQTGPLVTSPTEVLHDQQNKFIKVRMIALNKKFAFLMALDHIFEENPPPECLEENVPKSTENDNKKIISDEKKTEKIISDEKKTEKIISDEKKTEKIISDEKQTEKIISDEKQTERMKTDQNSKEKQSKSPEMDRNNEIETISLNERKTSGEDTECERSALMCCLSFDFVLCLGNYFDSDQDVFLALNETNNVRGPLLTESNTQQKSPPRNTKSPRVFSVSVGPRKSLANYCLSGPEEVGSLLRSLSKSEMK